MRAQILSISSVSRDSSHDWDAEARLVGFEKALGLVKGLESATDRERQTAIQNWVAAGTLSEAEKAVVAEFYEWERAVSSADGGNGT
jgi:hypothetical protein